MVVELEHVPLLRGVFHLWAFVAAIAAGIVLGVLADGVVATASSWVYATALAAMFGASALYHRVSWKSTAKRLWARRLDHSTIFVFIAATYTPFALLGLHGVMRWVVLAMAWADGCMSTRDVLVNWGVVCAANFAGAVGLAALVYLSGHAQMNGGAVAKTYLAIAQAKGSLPLAEAFFRGMLCNVLVCMAVWMTLAGRSVTDKFIAIVFPISAFVAAGFEHSIANMYLLPLAEMLKAGAGQPVEYAWLWRNLAPVIAGNLVGGSVLVALVYYVIYRRGERTTSSLEPSRKASEG